MRSRFFLSRQAARKIITGRLFAFRNAAQADKWPQNKSQIRYRSFGSWQSRITERSIRYLKLTVTLSSDGGIERWRSVEKLPGLGKARVQQHGK